MASPAINVYSIISPQTLWPPLPYPFPLFICPHYSSSPPIQASRFFRLKPLAIYSTYPFRFRPSFQSPRSIFSQKSQLSDVDEDEDEDEDEDDDDDDDVAAEEYDSDALGILEQSYEEVELSMEATEISTAPEEFKWQRVEKLLGEVKEFGEGIIDVDELASVYNFRIDKFQRLAIQAFLRGSSVVVSAPTSSGKTLIAEAAAVATVARKRRLFYTTPLKALSNQKFREFRETFGDSNVGLLTGDSAVNKDALVLIMTTEILRNMLYQR